MNCHCKTRNCVVTHVYPLGHCEPAVGGRGNLIHHVRETEKTDGKKAFLRLYNDQQDQYCSIHWDNE